MSVAVSHRGGSGAGAGAGAQRRRPRKTVAGLIIGNEILAGSTLDTNGHFLAEQCFAAGWSLRRLLVVPDIQEEIAEAARHLAATHDLVVTSGGVGPTHDDVTYAGVARAFDGGALSLHQPTADRMRHYFEHVKRPAVPVTPARLRMCTLPASSRVFYAAPPPTAQLAESERQYLLTDDSHPSGTAGSIVGYGSAVTTEHDDEHLHKVPAWVPVAICGRVHMLPGIPTLFRHLLTRFVSYTVAQERLVTDTQTLTASDGALRPRVRRAYATAMHEGDIADALASAESASGGRVLIGSYPVWRHSTDNQSSSEPGDAYAVKVTFEADMEVDVEAAVAAVQRTVADLRLLSMTD